MPNMPHSSLSILTVFLVMPRKTGTMEACTDAAVEACLCGTAHHMLVTFTGGDCSHVI